MLVTTTGMLETDTWYTGPAILYSKLTGLYDTLMLITHTPVDDGVLKVWHGLLVKSPNRIATPEDVTNARAYQEQSRLAFAQDFDIWAHKRPCINPLQIPTDGPFHKGRIWYGQFYNPRARAPEFHRRVNGVHVVKGMPAAPKRVGAA
jgi:3-ketosteroid 9alpha-monooxygenase subunit A